MKFDICYEKNKSFLVIPKSPKDGGKVEKIGLGSFKTVPGKRVISVSNTALQFAYQIILVLKLFEANWTFNYELS